MPVLSNTADPVRGALAGLAAGLVASLVMNQFQALAQKVMPPNDREEESEPATGKAADAVAIAATGNPVPELRKPAAGNFVHYAFGAAWASATASRPSTAARSRSLWYGVRAGRSGDRRRGGSPCAGSRAACDRNAAYDAPLRCRLPHGLWRDIGRRARPVAGEALIGLARAQIPRHFRLAQQRVDAGALVEALIG